MTVGWATFERLDLRPLARTFEAEYRSLVEPTVVVGRREYGKQRARVVQHQFFTTLFDALTAHTLSQPSCSIVAHEKPTRGWGGEKTSLTLK